MYIRLRATGKGQTPRVIPATARIVYGFIKHRRRYAYPQDLNKTLLFTFLNIHKHSPPRYPSIFNADIAIKCGEMNSAILTPHLQRGK